MFDYVEAMRRLIDDITERCEVLSHIDTTKVLVGCIKARKNGKAGLYARTVPLRFENGSQTTTRAGYVYRVPTVLHEGNEVLYIVSFCLPRFQNLPFEDKITTIFHELYHISPEFDGDIRRFEGSNYIHTSSQKKYDAHMTRLARGYLKNHPKPAIFEFLKLGFDRLHQKHSGVKITTFRTPRPEVVRRVEHDRDKSDGGRGGKK